MTPDPAHWLARAARIVGETRERAAAVDRVRAELEAADLTRAGALVLLYDDPARWEVRVSGLVPAGRVYVLRPDEIERKAGLS